MRFLCLHGRGTNSDIFEAQTAALFSRLSSLHTFDFLDAQFECPPAPGISQISGPPYLTWYPQYGTEHVKSVHEFLMSVIEEDGPYDGIIGFSEGAALAASFLLSNEHEIETCGGSPMFKLGVFFNSVMLFSPSEDIGEDVTEEVRRQEESLSKFLQGIDIPSVKEDSDDDDDENASDTSSKASAEVLQSCADDNSRIFGFPPGFHSLQISIPTLHFIGRNDQFAEHGRQLIKLSNSEKAEVTIVDGGHELPRSTTFLETSARLLEMAITLASLSEI